MKMLAAVLVAACSASAFAAPASFESAADDAHQLVTTATTEQKSSQAQTLVLIRDERGGPGRGGPGRGGPGRGGRGGSGGGWHHREGRRWRWHEGRACDELQFPSDPATCSYLAGSEGFPIYVMEGALCLGCD